MAQDRVEAVERALTVLESFDSAQERFSLAELAESTGYYKSTLLRLLGSLERFDYVQRDDDGRWRLGHTPLRLARRHPPGRQLAARVQPFLDRLAETLGETAALFEVKEDIAECRLVALPETRLRHDLHPGARWKVSDAEDPRPVLPGGAMVCHALATVGGEPGIWVSISGPHGRIEVKRAETALAAVMVELGSHQSGKTQETLP
jgi:DNA-binding IclR family transcriptional regulator